MVDLPDLANSPAGRGPGPIVNLVISEQILFGKDLCRRRIRANSEGKTLRHCHGRVDVRRLLKYAKNLALTLSPAGPESECDIGVLRRKHQSIVGRR